MEYTKDLTDEQAEIIKKELDKLGLSDEDTLAAKQLNTIFKNAKIKIEVPKNTEIEYKLFYESLGNHSKKSKAKARETRKHKKDDKEAPKGKRSKKEEAEEEEEEAPKGEKSKEGKSSMPYDITSKIAPGVLEDMRAAFDSLDKDGSGTIDLEELKKEFEKYGAEGDPKAIKSVLAIIDENENGKIDFNEFVLIMSGEKPCDLNNRKDLKKIFEEFDIDGDGKISAVDLITTNDELGEDAPGDEIKKMMKIADATDDGKIDFEDFYYIMTVGEEELNERKKKLDMEEREKKKEKAKEEAEKKKGKAKEEASKKKRKA